LHLSATAITMPRISALLLFIGGGASLVLGQDALPEAWFMKCRGACNTPNAQGWGIDSDCGERTPGFTAMTAFQGGEKDFYSGCQDISTDDTGMRSLLISPNAHRLQASPLSSSRLERRAMCASRTSR
jgi:hypothetical protein